MKKIILIDGNNLLFRSYFATAYSGNFMRNSKGFPTNALYGFVNMINKIISEEQPTYIMVAFDKGKTFRHVNYKDYKGGREETPFELKEQFPIAKDILNALGIKYCEIDMYEADDIIGTYARVIDETDGYTGTIISSDKDLLQLISNKIEVKLLKSGDYIRMNRDVFFDTYGIEPIKMIDLKGLIGDPSDNIPGVKGVGEKTGLKLLTAYKSIEGVYENIDRIKGSVREKLINDKDKAFMSKELATICKTVPIDVDLEDLKDKRDNNDEVVEIYKDLEFYSFLKNNNENNKVEEKNHNTDVSIIADSKNIEINEDVAVYLDLDGDNYHKANILGLSIYGPNTSLYVPFNMLDSIHITSKNIYTYDIKKLYVALKKRHIELNNITFDTLIAAHLLNLNVKDDIAYLANSLGYNIEFTDYDKIKEITELAKLSINKARFIYETKNKLESDIKNEDMNDLFYNIEMPLTFTLGRMELEGIRIDKNILNEMNKELSIKIELLKTEIYNHAGEEFNISSPKQLGDILFRKLNLPYSKKTATGFSTDVGVLEKLIDKHPIIGCILEYRMVTKLLSTYANGLLNSVLEDGKIHTIYTQTITRTGRLSSIEPNLQNIPIRSEYGRLIRKCFIPEANSKILSSDYSQFELRIFTHFSGVQELIDAFNNGMDIHKKTAMDIFHVNEDDVTSTMRRQAKAVNFGILYGISSYGLSEDLKITPKEAKEFINRYLEAYPGIKKYMECIINEAKQNGFVKTLMGRKRIIEELNNKNYIIRNMGERMALNTPIQGSQADILKKAMIEIDHEIIKRNLKSRMLLQVHDELIFNVTNDELEIVKDLIKSYMENAYKLNVPIIADINIGNNWYEAK